MIDTSQPVKCICEWCGKPFEILLDTYVRTRNRYWTHRDVQFPGKYCKKHRHTRSRRRVDILSEARPRRMCSGCYKTFRPRESSSDTYCQRCLEILYAIQEVENKERRVS